jgi:two-component system nitrogen regulation response regulator NtrX
MPYKTTKFREARAKFEKVFILKKLEEFDGNVTKTADAMGMERSHLYRKMRQFELVPENEKSNDEEKLNENIN